MFGLHHHFKPKLLLFSYSFNVHSYHLRAISSFCIALSWEKTSILKPKLTVTIHVMLKTDD
jgi:hypothetical protein